MAAFARCLWRRRKRAALEGARCIGVVDRNHTSAASVLREALTDRLTAYALALRWICLESPRGSDRRSLQMPSPVRAFPGTACSTRSIGPRGAAFAWISRRRETSWFYATPFSSRDRADPEGLHDPAGRARCRRAGRAHRSWLRPQVVCFFTIVASAKERRGRVVGP